MRLEGRQRVPTRSAERRRREREGRGKREKVGRCTEDKVPGRLLGGTREEKAEVAAFIELTKR